MYNRNISNMVLDLNDISSPAQGWWVQAYDATGNWIEWSRIGAARFLLGDSGKTLDLYVEGGPGSVPSLVTRGISLESSKMLEALFASSQVRDRMLEELRNHPLEEGETEEDRLALVARRESYIRDNFTC